MRYTLLTLFFVLSTIIAGAQKAKVVNPNDFIMECMKNTGELPDKQLVLWVPSEYWKLVGDQMKMPKESIDRVESEMRNYMLFLVVDYTIAPPKFVFKSEDDIRKTLKLTDSLNNVYLPLKTEEISPNVQDLLNVLKPVFAQLCGQLGEGMKMFLFDAHKVNAKSYVDLAKRNKISLSWEATKVSWTLPFASVLEPKFCPIDHDQMKGNWNYCPVHGTKLN